VLQNFLYTAKIQQLAVNEAARSLHPTSRDPPGRTPLTDQAAPTTRRHAALIGDIKKRHTALGN
jgi:hypothetical protein